MDLHKITTLPHSHFVKEKMPAAKMDQLIPGQLRRVQYTSGCAGTGWKALLSPLTVVLLHHQLGRRMMVDRSSTMRPESCTGKGGSRMEPEYLFFKNMLSSGKPRSPNFQYMVFCMFLGKEICCSPDWFTHQESVNRVSLPLMGNVA